MIRAGGTGQAPWRAKAPTVDRSRRSPSHAIATHHGGRSSGSSVLSARPESGAPERANFSLPAAVAPACHRNSQSSGQRDTQKRRCSRVRPVAPGLDACRRGSGAPETWAWRTRPQEAPGAAGGPSACRARRHAELRDRGMLSLVPLRDMRGPGSGSAPAPAYAALTRACGAPAPAGPDPGHGGAGAA